MANSEYAHASTATISRLPVTHAPGLLSVRKPMPRIDCDTCDTCLLPAPMRPPAARSKPTSSPDRDTLPAMGAAYLNQLMSRMKSADAKGGESHAALVDKAASFSAALQLALTPHTPDSSMISAQSLYSQLWRDIEALARQRKVMVLWRIDHNPALTRNSQGRAIEGLRQMCLGALRLVGDGGNLLVDLARGQNGGLNVSFSAHSFLLPDDWDNMDQTNGTCPIPIGALCALRVGLKLLDLTPKALQMQHEFSQSVMRLELNQPISS